MFKIKIVHKGLVLVAVPLVIGTIFNALLLFGLSDANRLVQRALMLKDAMIWQIVLSECTVAAVGCEHCFKLGHDPFFREHYKANIAKGKEANERLESLLKVPSLIPPKQLAELRANPGISLRSTKSPLSQYLQRMSERQAKMALNAMEFQQAMLFGGMAACVLVSAALAIFFCLNITNRLLIILSNTVSLSKGTPSNAPLKGSDEIADLDQFLFKSATEIAKLERFKREMIGVVSHELKSPLSSVAGFLSSLGAGVFGELSPKAIDKVERTHNSVKRLMVLIKDLLFLDRLELELTPETVPVAEILTASVDAVKELSDQSGIEIVVRNEANEVFADRNRLVQVIVNLLSNAIKFSPAQGRVTLETKQGDGFFECRVSDQGRGIPEDLCKQIFEPFKQVDARDKIDKKGTGLGLTISHSIIEQHGGSIGVDSRMGEGSTFWFKIPGSAVSNQDSTQSSAQTKIIGMAGASLPSDQLKTIGRGSASLPSARKNELLHSDSRRRQRFGVLQQGLVMIAMPLTFQLLFAGIIGYQLNEVRLQTKREENSKRILDLLCKSTDVLLTTNNAIVLYVFANDPVSKRTWESNKRRAAAYFDQAMTLSAGDSKRLKVIKECRTFLDQFGATVDKEAAKPKTNAAFFKKLAESGVLGTIVGMGAMGSSSIDEIVAMIPTDSGMSSFEVLTQIQSQSMRLVEEAKPVYVLKQLIERVMTREVGIGAKLSAQRAKMIKTLELTLCAGIVLNFGLSVFLALTLLRSLTSRLQHVMENTARLVKREALAPPIKAADEIADLDLILYETGSHLVELESFKRELVAIVSHELRTPLLSVSAALELFETGVFGDLSEKGKMRLKLAQSEAQRLIRLINDLLDIEKMDAGKFVLDISEQKVADIVSSSVAAVAQLAEVRRITIDSEFSINGEVICADRDRLCQVLINLLSNAIKYSPDDGTIKVTVEKSTSDGEMKFCVIDQGRGIPEELRERIFDRFIQVEKSDETERGGSGLGLAISKAIVEQHGGSIGVESEIGRGSKFYFKLPVTAAKQC